LRVFVTGGTGLIGRHIIQQLIARGDVVTALARSDRAAFDLRALGVTPVPGDVTDEVALAQGAADADAVVHAAAIVIGHGAPWERFHAVNVAPTETLARAAAKRGARFVHISSVAVYGRRQNYDGGPGSVDETFGLERPLFPGDHYARSKREAELALWRVADETGLSAAALRPCVVYGEGDRNFSPRVARVLKRGVATIIGSGANRLSVVYAGNVAAAALLALDRRDVRGAFNVANDGMLTQREFVERFAAGLGRRALVLPIPSALAWGAARASDDLVRLFRPAAPVSFLKTAVQFLSSTNPYSSAKAERELGWRPLTPAPEAAERTGRWFQGRGTA
jgi:nucleoside-diphosphate-sugar epimerase